MIHQAHPTAVESPREHGLVAGAMSNAWIINRQLYEIVQLTSCTNNGSYQVTIPDPQPPDILTMAAETIKLQGETIKVLERLQELLEEHNSSIRRV